MKTLSTPQVAAEVGIDPVTLERWLGSGKVRGPKLVRAGMREYRIWARSDVERLKRHKTKFYRKGRGRKKKT